MRISDVDISLLVNNKQAILCNLRYLGLTFFYESKFPFDVHVATYFQRGLIMTMCGRKRSK